MLAYIRFSALLWTFFIGGALSAPRSVSSPRDIRSKREALPTTTPNPCGSIVDDVNDGYAYHYASDAFACLTSVPFNPAVATRFIKYVNDTIQFQSTIDYLKEPPAGYQQPAVDIPSELARIQYNVKTRAYSNQYQFELDIKRLLYSAHDGHLYLSGGVTAAFSFLAPYSITSASSDGKNVPEVFITDDIIKSKKEGWKPSPIKMINNEVAEDYLTKFASLNAFGGIEPHADWNQLFFTPALTIQSSGSIWDSNVAFYPGDVLEITLENGTEYIDPWLALWTEPFPTGPLTTGGDMYNYFALGLLPASYKVNGTDFNPAYNSSGQAKPSVREETWSSISYGAYPQPEVWQADPNFYKYGSAAGFINPSFSVLSIPSFVQYGKSIGNFSGAVSNFISGALEAKTNKVIIDLQQNRGGTVELAFSTFKRFFPDEEPFAGSRRRKHQLGDIIGEAYTAYFNKLRTTDDEYQNYLADEWVATTRLNAATDQNFSSWAELSSFESGDKSHSSAVERFNISNYEYAAALFEGWVPRGYTLESPLPSTITPFKPENIIILTDGACASTCALMVEMFKQVGVRTVAVGGRPEKGPMQAVGGTRGAAIYSADQIDMHIRKLRTESFGMREQDLAILPLLTEAGYRDPGVYSRVMAVNLRDQVRLNDTIPLQFKYEAAHCRIFYTLKNVWNMTQLWQDVSTASEDVSLCVGGSTRYTDADEPPPAPMAVQEIAWNVNMSEPDAFLIDEDFDLNGGPQGCLVFGNCVLGEFKPQHCTESGGCNNAAQQCIEYVSIEGCSGIQDVSVRRCVGRATPLVCEKFPNFVFDTTWQNDVDVLGFGSLAPRKTVILGPKPGFHAMEVNFRSNKRTLKESGFCRPKPGKDSRCP